MTVIAVQPIVLKDCKLLVEADNYEAHVSKVSLDPTTSSQTWKGLTPSASFTDSSSPTWVCSLEYAQDWETTDSLSRYLFENQGETVTAKFQPKKGTGLPEFTVELVIVAGPIGGAIDAFAVGSVSLGVNGQPVLGVAA